MPTAFFQRGGSDCSVSLQFDDNETFQTQFIRDLTSSATVKVPSVDPQQGATLTLVAQLDAVSIATIQHGSIGSSALGVLDFVNGFNGTIDIDLNIDSRIIVSFAVGSFNFNYIPVGSQNNAVVSAGNNFDACGNDSNSGA